MFGGVSSSFIYTLGEYNNTTAFIVIVSMPGYQTVQRSIPMTSWADLQTNGINTGRITLTPTS